MIPVTKSFLPPIEEFTRHVQRAFDNGWLTNRGQLVQELEGKLSSYLGVSKILITNNGTIPLQIALKLLGKGGEVITTPFSYVATTAAIVWEGCTPVFVDVHPEQLTIDVSKIEAAITEKTTCILATHVFGNPCDVDEIQRIANKYDLKVIYDGAHSFGVNFKGKSIFEYGDITTCSFHATKLFHTGEGGAIFCQDPELFHQIFFSHNFGHRDEISFYGLGINGKISELQAAMGLSVFPYIDEIIAKRYEAIKIYENRLDTRLKRMQLLDNTKWNNSYFPLVFESEEQLLHIIEKLEVEGIRARRYFYPSLNTLPYVLPTEIKIAESISKRILCLPLYHSLDEKDQARIISIINNNL